MKFSRRDFMKIGGAAAVGTLGLSRIVFGQSAYIQNLPAETLADPLFHYGSDVFKNYIGSEFSFVAADVSTTAVLINVSGHANRKSRLPRGGFGKTKRQTSPENFTLTFRLSPEAPQDTYQVFHSRLGAFSLFSVPGKSDAGDNLLHAVINRI